MTRGSKYVFAAFAGTQLLDVGLTFAGVTLGLASEANPLIAWMAGHIGLLAALFAVKILAFALGAALVAHGRTMLLALITLFYWGVAILPWLLILGVVRF